MSRIRAALAAIRRDDPQAGFTLIEMLIATSIFLTLSVLLLTSVLSTARGVANSREYNDLNEEARLLLNRMSRELREAQLIQAASNPGGSTFDPNADSSVTFEVDFNGNGIVEEFAADPEILTYTFHRAANQVTLQAAGETFPILAANVSFFRLSYESRIWTRDVNRDGTVTWQELDSDPSFEHGNGNGVLDTPELRRVTSVTIEVHVLRGTRRQEYRTQVDLRNAAHANN